MTDHGREAPTTDLDLAIIGAGFSGLYAMHKARDVMGLNVQGFEAGGGVGGTWYWNRYPGARCDIESIYYSYSFDDEIAKKWRWSEKFAGQPEILAYLEHVADKLDLRRGFAFDTRIVSTVWNEAAGHWTLTSEDGASTTARFVIAGTGPLSIPKENEFPGLAHYTGEVHRTGKWPHEGVDFAGKRVAVIGTGATAIQAIPRIAEQAGTLTVFQRTPNFAAPLDNGPLDPTELDDVIANYAQVRENSRNRFIGADYPLPEHPSALGVSDDERKRVYDKYYVGGGFRMITSTFGDLMFSAEANETVSEYLRERIRERVKDPKTAEILSPRNHFYATKRPPFETGYYEAYNRENVSLVDLRATPIEDITERGIRTTDAEYEFDVLVLATGFDAFTGPLLQLGLVGRDGVRLSDYWADGPHTYLGIAITGFPNLFMPMGPQSVCIHINNPPGIEDHVDFALRAIAAATERGTTALEPTIEATDQWNSYIWGIADSTLMTKVESWYMGSNVPGKPRAPLFFAGGAVLYRAIFAQVEGNGFAGFAFDGAAEAIPTLTTLDPMAAHLLGAVLAQDQRPLDAIPLDEQRVVLENFAQLQLPPRKDVAVHHTTYPTPGGERPVRVYVPENAEGPLPVLVFLHPGGWYGGSPALSEGPCTGLAEDLGAVVVSPDYRLAPENPFPAATDDSYAAVTWAAAAITEYGGDPTRIAVLGESAGGTLAAVAAQRARDEHGPELVGQVLLYPPIDPDEQTGSKERYREGPILTAAAAQQCWDRYLQADTDRSSPLAVPSRAESLAGLAPALVLTVELDPSRDEAEAYGRALQEAGVPTEIVRIPGLIHAALNMSGFVPRTSEITDAIVAFLAPRFASTSREAARA
ncbi:flavin-containing monooxygenase [Pseudonocardia broussonetiae]|uniref:Alpha/beta hydrolase fold domain-containing protein n=1 Tax=Pseudonocardia broussonetiae TaxID=2736640 RepID=A0A6M6JG08_9PSEU|nr:alpha/beta hydrolase fold domain-containing protein [Pseudonocardia broussonetiae]QJY46075.1 alpha/beta hydrolase fold domain-containing protein [Pseudonocardia broussonetiae]